MPNPFFRFKQFTVYHQHNAMKVTTDSCLFGAWVADEMGNVNSKMKNGLDIGTGTGLLSLMITQKNDVIIDAVEIDIKAAEEAKENIENSPWKQNIRVHHQNILNFHPEHQYDFIVCNPPFYENELQSENSKKNTAHHSEQLTLNQVLNFIKTNLTPTGVFYILLPGKRETKLKLMLQEMDLHIQKAVMVHLSDSNKRIMICGVKYPVHEMEEEQIHVNDERFKYLLKDYYLYA